MAKIHGNISGEELLALLQKMTPEERRETLCEIHAYCFPDELAQKVGKSTWDNDTGEWFELICPHGISKGAPCRYCEETPKFGTPCPQCGARVNVLYAGPGEKEYLCDSCSLFGPTNTMVPPKRIALDPEFKCDGCGRSISEHDATLTCPSKT